MEFISLLFKEKKAGSLPVAASHLDLQTLLICISMIVIISN